MKQTESQTNNSIQDLAQSSHDIKICNECVELMRQTSEKCRIWSKETNSSVCKGSFATTAFVCDSLASSMEACMKLMRTNSSENMVEKKSCCN
jgi:hypothetical protein